MHYDALLSLMLNFRWDSWVLIGCKYAAAEFADYILSNNNVMMPSFVQELYWQIYDITYQNIK